MNNVEIMTSTDNDGYMNNKEDTTMYAIRKR